MIRHRFYLQLGLVSIGLLLGFGVSTGCQHFKPQENNPVHSQANLRLIEEAWDKIERFYVDRDAVKPKEMTYGAISGMVDSLGDTGHSQFLTPEMMKQEHHLMKGELEGIGAELQVKNSQVVIVAPMDHSPALRAGLKPGDVILKVNGQDVGGLPLEQVATRILGPPGTVVKLTILDPISGRTRDLDLTRARVLIRTITWYRLPGMAVAHLRISTFSKGAIRDLRKALTDMEKDGVRGIILDLRNNPGGLFQEAVSIASQFLAGGNVLLKKDSMGQIGPVSVEPGGLAPSIPLVVLINGGTASGAEIVAGALQDSHRAILIGEKTFGTGTVLQEFPLMDGSALLLAVEEWLTPDGHVIWHRGIAPEVVVNLPPEVTPLIPEREKEMTAEKVRDSGDRQLLKALDLIVQAERKIPGAAIPLP